MDNKTKIYIAFTLAWIVSICWIIGDVALVGFEPSPEKYPLFSVDYAQKVDVDTAVHMLEGSTPRLMFGALIGALTAPLLLPAMWLLRQFFRGQNSCSAWLTYLPLMAGVVLSPLGHAAFFYVGEIYKLVLNTDQGLHLPILQTADDFVNMLNMSWLLAVMVLGLGWINLMIAILLKRTHLPRWMAILTPVPLSIMILLMKYVINAPYAAWIGGATFNLAYLIFFVVLFSFRQAIIGSK
ncbi:DUF6796 family protein [Streptococcus entericus]|uniref:DUF6796 family protein n=1 Tax=Streptococcus entericus TaxID=155680 RepID=UPI00039F3C9A|nr:DUF6796 family protein [Streptococcus entericus]